jgi:hypothetical protein
MLKLCRVIARPLRFVLTTSENRVMAERWQSAARDLGLSIGSDFIASPLHCVVRPACIRLKVLPIYRGFDPRFRSLARKIQFVCLAVPLPFSGDGVALIGRSNAVAMGCN